jgi:hypothetical protein
VRSSLQGECVVTTQFVRQRFFRDLDEGVYAGDVCIVVLVVLIFDVDIEVLNTVCYSIFEKFYDFVDAVSNIEYNALFNVHGAEQTEIWNMLNRIEQVLHEHRRVDTNILNLVQHDRKLIEISTILVQIRQRLAKEILRRDYLHDFIFCHRHSFFFKGAIIIILKCVLFSEWKFIC